MSERDLRSQWTLILTWMADFDAELFAYYTANNYIYTKQI